MTMPKLKFVNFTLPKDGRVDKTIYLSPVRLEIIRRYFADSYRASQGRMFLQFIDEKKVRIEVFSHFDKDIKTASRILTSLLNDPKEVTKARQSLKLHEKPLR